MFVALPSMNSDSLVSTMGKEAKERSRVSCGLFLHEQNRVLDHRIGRGYTMIEKGIAGSGIVIGGDVRFSR